MQPPCAATQLTTTSARSYTGGVLSASFSRPLAVTPAQAAQGFVAIPNAPIAIVAAIGGGVRPTQACDMTGAEHYGAFHNIWINLGST